MRSPLVFVLVVAASGLACTRPAPTPEPIEIPAGTVLAVTLDSSVSSDNSRAEEAVTGRLAEPVRSGEREVVPKGAEVRGHVLAAERSGKVKGRARLAITFDRLVANGQTYDITARPIDVTAESSKGRDAKIVGGGALVGAIIGGIKDGGSGAAKGGLLGGAAGGGAVLLTRGKEVEFPAGTRFKVTLRERLVLD
jgi:hypothetical protein